LVSLALDNPIPRLATVVIRGMLERVGDRTGFTRRALAGAGRYVTPDMLARNKSRCVLDGMRSSTLILPKGMSGCSIRWPGSTGFRGVSSLQGVQPIKGDPGEGLQMPVASSTTSSCLTVWIDDFNETPDMNGDIELSWLDPKEVAGVEFYRPAASPVRIGGGTCHALIIWTLAYHGGGH
jgi:hypothetical protein